MKNYASIILLFVCLQTSFGQTKDYSKDVESVDSIIKALYEVISGDPGAVRDWDRFKNLFTADAKLIPTFKDKEGKIGYRTMTPTDYVQMFTSRVTTGFHERELNRVTEEFGNVVHVFSVYETKEKSDGPVTQRGINSIQLLRSNDRYYVMNIFWSGENKDNPIPEKYLKKN
jgi:hypothetical protein